jgi:protoheme IX farnesyltransferase
MIEPTRSAAAPSQVAAPLTDAAGAGSVLRDLVTLAKPRIVMMSVFVAGGGMALAGPTVSAATALFALLGVGMVVGGAGALNMVLERIPDRLMTRTRERPVAAGRLHPLIGAIFGLLLGGGAVALLALMVNPLTALLGAFGLVIYVLIYTPLKRVTPGAVLVGGVAGALPPLMGWTAVTGSMDLPGLALFATLFFWQVPHFIAITVYRSDEYRRAGFPTRIALDGAQVAWRHLVLHSGVLLMVSLALLPLGTASWIYGGAALTAGVSLLLQGIRGLRASRGHADEQQGPGLARTYFRWTLVYLPVLAISLVLDRWLLGAGA